MEKTKPRRSNIAGVEENTLAILESAEARDTPDANDDRISYLEAVRTTSLVSENGTAPTNKMYEAVFQILRVVKSLELITSSYQLLNELDERFPRVYLSKLSSGGSHELVLIDEAWLPFIHGSDVASTERELGGRNSSGLLDSSGFARLIQELAEVVNRADLQAIETKNVRNMLLLQYLVNVLEGDFLPRKIVYEETVNWTILRESLLSMLLASRRINYKSLIKDCLSLLCGLCQFSTAIINNDGCSENSVTKSSKDCDTALTFALLELGKKTCTSMQKLLTMIMDLDTAKKEAGKRGHTTRADGVRTPLLEIILDELTYDGDIVFPFFQVFNEPKRKLDIIVQYFLKYTAKPSVRSRRSNSPADDATFDGILKGFSNISSTKNILKKMGADIVQLLLVQAFQAHLSISSQHVEGILGTKDQTGDSSLMEICKNMISCFNSLRKADKKMEILPIGKEALFTASSILSMCSTGSEKSS